MTSQAPSIVIRDGEQQVLAFFPVRQLERTRSQTEFTVTVPFTNANHFTAAMTVTVQIRDAAGNVSPVVTGRITIPISGGGRARSPWNSSEICKSKKSVRYPLPI